MASTAGFRHNRLKRRHLDSDGELMPENKRYFSEKFAQEMGVLKLDDHATVPQSIGSPQRYFAYVLCNFLSFIVTLLITLPCTLKNT
jgi:hypothetical protein